MDNTSIKRQDIFKRAKTIVVKLGTAMITDKATHKLSKDRIKIFVDEIVKLRQKGYKVILVSSGAVASGSEVLFGGNKPDSVPKRQAAASVGQIRLMGEYAKYFSRKNINIGQVLLSDTIVRDRLSYLNAKNTFYELLMTDTVPVINENDTITTNELQFGDNDFLSATVATLVEADLLVILTDVDGVYQNFADKENRKRYDIVRIIDDAIRCEVKGAGSKFSKGGMATKISAMEVAMSAGIVGIIGNGFEKNILSRITSGEDLGTLFFPKIKDVSQRKKWLATNLKHTNKGLIVIDEGAVLALTVKNRSLLPSGIVKVEGNFEKGDGILIVSKDGKNIARGMTNYNSSDVDKIKGMNSRNMHSIVRDIYDEVVHKDNLVILPN